MDFTLELDKKFAARSEESREDIIALCGRLVAARSINPPGDTREVAMVVAGALSELGLQPRIEADDPIKPSVVAELDSGRPGRHLVLNVHMDTMPVGDETAWQVPPFEMTRTSGRLYGLGMGNMKGAVAAMVHAFSTLAENQNVWNGKVTFTAVSDEVVFGDKGAAHLLNTIPDLAGDGLLCGEGPGFKRLAVAEKGVLWLRLIARGEAGHSSSVTRLNSATARLATVLARVDKLNGTRANAPTALAGLIDSHDSGFDLTVNIGTITAGTFISQVAVDGSAEVDIRVPPGMTCDEAQGMVCRLVEDIEGVEVHRLKGWDPNWTGLDTDLAQAWLGAHRSLEISENGTADLALAIRLPASDATRWRLRGVPALCYGPQPHFSVGVDEYVEEDEVLRCATLYATCAARFLQSDNNS